MLARRIIAVSPDAAFAEQLATALHVAGGAVDAHHTLASLGAGDLEAALCVIHVDGELAGAASEILPRLTGDCRVIAVLPRSSLVSVVDLMQASDRVAGMMIAEDFDSRLLSAMATRILSGDIFGLDKIMVSGTQVHSELVGDYEEKSLCMARIAGLAEQVRVPRKYHASIEQCVDEMLMNAMYDAPVDELGKHIFADIPTKARITLRTHPVVVEYAYDGRQFAISVRDAFGSLDRATMLRVLHKCLHADEQIDRKASGAGVGLYLMVNSATTVHFNVVPAVATEAVCAFAFESPKLQLQQLGFFEERTDVTGKLATPSRQLPASTLRAVARLRLPPRPSRRGLVAVLSAAIIAVVAIGIVAWPHLFPTTNKTRVTFTTIPKGATIEIDGRPAGTATSGTLAVDDLEIGHAYGVVARLEGYQPKHTLVEPLDGTNNLTLELQRLTPTVALDSEPTGAAVEIDGKPMGSTPLALTSLAPGADVAIVFKRPGYHDATARVKVPGRGEQTHFMQKLEVSDDFVRVRFVSKPPGAQVIEQAAAPRSDRTYTPAELFVEANKVQRFMLTMPNHVPLVIEPFTPVRGAGVVEKGGTLVEGVTLRIEATSGGKVTVAGAPHCTDLAVPLDCTLAPGSYVVDYVGPKSAKATRTVKVADQDATVKF